MERRVIAGPLTVEPIEGVEGGRVITIMAAPEVLVEISFPPDLAQNVGNDLTKPDEELAADLRALAARQKIVGANGQPIQN